MEFTILGLLFLKPMTGYEISRFIKNNLSMICSSSAGSAQIALKKLVASGCINFEEFVENGKNKKIFSVAEKGREEFLAWIQKPMQVDKVKNMELSKLFFLGFAEKEKRIETIKSNISQLKNIKNTLVCIQEEFENSRALALKNTQNSDDISTFQRYTLNYGIDSAEFEIDWYTKLLSKMED